MVLLAEFCTLQVKKGEMPCVSHLDAGCYPLYRVRDTFWLHRLFLFLFSFILLVTLTLLSSCIFEEVPWYISSSANFKGGKSLLAAKERLKSTKFYSRALFLACCSCQKPEHGSDKMNMVEKESIKWVFVKNWVIFVWKVLRANVICITIVAIIQKVLFLLVSVCMCFEN